MIILFRKRFSESTSPIIQNSPEKPGISENLHYTDTEGNRNETAQ